MTHPRSRHVRRDLVAATLAVAALVLSATPAAGQQPRDPVEIDADIIVTTDPGGVTTHIELRHLLPGQPSAAGTQTPAAGPTQASYCQVARLFGSVHGGPLVRPGLNYAQMRCGSDPGGFITILNLADGQPDLPQATVAPDALARALRDRLPAPAVQITAVPARALTGTPTRFWLTTPDGAVYAGDPLTQTTTLGDLSVQVQARPTRYQWSFGEPGPSGQMTTTSPGHPERGEVEHIYQRATSGAPVRVTFAFAVRWRQLTPEVRGWAALEPISRQVTTTLPVAQSLGVLTQ